MLRKLHTRLKKRFFAWMEKKWLRVLLNSGCFKPADIDRQARRINLGMFSIHMHFCNKYEKSCLGCLQRYCGYTLYYQTFRLVDLTCMRQTQHINQN